LRDVEALLLARAGHQPRKVIYDGDLSGITERFGQAKLVKLQFAGRRRRTTWNSREVTSRKDRPPI